MNKFKVLFEPGTECKETKGGGGIFMIRVALIGHEGLDSLVAEYKDFTGGKDA